MNATRFPLAVAALCLFSQLSLADPQCGDVNADGTIDSMDALLIQRHAFGLLTLTPNQLTRADVDGDLDITFNDAIRVLQFISGAPVALECPPVLARKLYVPTFTPRRLVVLNADTHEVLSEVPIRHTPIAVANDPTRERVYLSTFEGILYEIDTETDTVSRTIKIPGLFGALEVTCNGERLIGITQRGIVIVALPEFRVLQDLHVGSGHYGPGFLATTSDSRDVWISDTNVGQVMRISTEGQGLQQTIDVGNGPTGIAVSRDRSRLFVANFQDHSLSVVNTRQGAEISVGRTGLWPFEVVLHSNGSIYVAGSLGRSVTEHNSLGLITSSFTLSSDPLALHEVRGTGVLSGIPMNAPTLSLLDPNTGVESVVDFAGIGIPIDVTSH